MPVSRVSLLRLAGFAVALASGATGAGACKDSTNVDACGDALPMEGSLCTREGQECLPDEVGCGLYTGVRCESGVWVFFEAGTGVCTDGDSMDDTEAPAVPCEGEDLPPEGTRCEQEGEECAPGKDVCAGYAGAACAQGRWKRFEVPAGTPEDCKGAVDCEAVCTGILAAKCAAGPADAPACASDCESWVTGACGVEFSSAVTCGGEPPSFMCGAGDRPAISGCEPEFEAFYGCLD